MSQNNPQYFQHVPVLGADLWYFRNATSFNVFLIFKRTKKRQTVLFLLNEYKCFFVLNKYN